MSKVYFIERYKGSILSKALMADGRLLEFSMNGFVREAPMEFNNPYMREVDIVSFLVQNGGVEVATSVNGIFTKWMSDVGIQEITNKMKVFKLPQLLFQSIRRDEVEGIKYTQYIYVFDKNVIDNMKLQGVINNG